MEKISIEEFEVHRKRMLEILKEVEGTDSQISVEREEELVAEYGKIMKSILNCDLSDIPASVWEGIYIFNPNDEELNFEGTNANLDFSLLAGIDIAQRRYGSLISSYPNFKGCKITNFPFGKYVYTPEMFDDAFVAENADRFLSSYVPEDLRESFYAGKLTFLDLQANQEISEKFIPEQLNDVEREIYELLGREKFLKLDFTFLDATKYWVKDILDEKNDFQSAEEVMEYLYTTAKETLVDPTVEEEGTKRYIFVGNPAKMGDVFRKRYPELYISDAAPDYLKTAFYTSNLYLIQYINNIEYFKNTDMRLGFRQEEYKLYQYFGEDMYELFERYGKYIEDQSNNYYSNIRDFNIPENPEGTIEEKKRVLTEVIKKRLESSKITNLSDIRILTELLPIEDIIGPNINVLIIDSVGFDKLKELGISSLDTFKEGITNVKTLQELSKFIPDISLVTPLNFNFSKDLTLDIVVNAGVEDISIFSKDYTQDIKAAKELIDKGIPLEFLNFGNQSFTIRNFIKTYGIDNIVKFEEETKLFSVQQINGKNCQLELLALQEKNMPRVDVENTDVPDYETFRDRVYEILVAARDSKSTMGRKGILTSRDFFDYGHMEGKFREEHPEIFIDNVPEEISRNFYLGALKPGQVKEHPELVEVLMKKNIELAFSQEIKFPGLASANGDIIGFVTESFADYVSQKYGKENFLKLCVVYGDYISDKTNFFRNTEASFEEFVEELEKNIYRQIQIDLEYGENLPESFKMKYPELFLSETIPTEIKELFYKGSLKFEDIKDHPELATELLGKDADVGFRQLKRANWGVYDFRQQNAHLNHRYKEFFEKLSKEDILKLSEKYGKYLTAVKPEDLQEDYSSFDELEKMVKQRIREGILSGTIRYSDKAPEFFKEEHPEFFLPDDAPELLKLAYYSDYISRKEPYLNHASSNYNFKITLLKEHPEFKPYLDGKKFDLLTDSWATNLATKFSSQEIFEMIDIDPEALALLSRNTEVVARLRRNIDERPKDRENILNFPGYTLYYSDEKREEFDFAEYREIVKMSKFTVSDNYRRDTAEQILSTMYDFLGYAGSKEILRLPELDEDRINEIIRTHGQTFSELYEERFELKGNLRVLNKLFDKFVPQLPGKKGSLNVYKLLNQKLEEGYNGNLEDLLLALMNENNLDFEEDKIKMVSKAAVDTNTSEKLEMIYERVSSYIENDIEETVANKKILKDILLNTYRKTLNKYEKLDENVIREILEQEFSRTREDGGTFYSPHITDHLEDLLKITQQINDSPEYGDKVNKSVVDILREEKERIGQGWIRKLLDLHPELGKEEIETLKQKLYGDSNTDRLQNIRIVRLRDTSEIGMENAYVFLKELELPGIFTYEKGEQMFAGLSKPYSENFRDFFLKNQKDILRLPEYYTIFQRMHSEFERIIEDPHVSTRFKAGLYSLKELKVELDRTTYPDVKEGEYELEYAARKAGLETEYWPRAQEVYQQMLERETQTVPPVEFSGKKYRGRILRIDDPLHLVMGHVTTCCQRFGRGQPGEPSMLHSALERNGSVFVVEEIDEQGRIVGSPIAQSWTWRNGDRICFDNVEIPDTLESELKAKDAYDSILTIYMETAKKMIDIDKRMLKKMLEEGRITQEQYDQFTIKEVTIGLGCDDLLRNVSPRMRTSLEHTNAVMPIEAGKLYETVSGEMKRPWIDSASQFVLASSEDTKKTGKHTTYSGEVFVEYTKIREVLRREGRNINSDLILRMKQMVERAGKTDTSLIGNLESNSIVDFFYDGEDYLENEKTIKLSQSSNDDWYILTREEKDSITILDSLITTGVNTVENQQEIDSKLARYEYLNEMLAIMQIAHKAGKGVKIDLEKEGEYLKLEPLFANGTLIFENGNITIGNDKNVKRIRESLTEKIEKGKEARILGENIETDEKPNKDDDERL